MESTAVVILNWNGLSLLKEFIPQVIMHTIDADIIVIDNCSSDGSVHFLSVNHPTVKLVLLDKNYGFAGGYNRGLQGLSYRFFILLNSDVAPTANWIQPLVYELESNSNVSVSVPKIMDYRDKIKFEYAGGAGGFIDYLGYPFCRGRVFDTIEEDRGQYNDSTNVFWASGAAFAIKASVFFELGGFDEDFFAHQEEIDLCWRINNCGYEIRFVPDSMIYHLGGATLNTSSPQKTYLNFRNNLFLLLKNYPKSGLYKTLFLRMMLDGIAAVKFLTAGQFYHSYAILKAHIHFYRGYASFFAKRSGSIKELEKLHPLIYKKSIVRQYFLKHKTYYSDLN